MPGRPRFSRLFSPFRPVLALSRRLPWNYVGYLFLFTATFLVLLAGGGFLFEKLNLAHLRDIDASAKVVSAAIILVGSLAASLMTLLGLMMKDAIDHRTLQFKELTEAQRVQEAKAAEERLRMDTCIKAVELMGPIDHQDSFTLRRAGALMALTALGQTEFALGLLNEVWRRESVPAPTAVLLIDKALQSSDPNLQNGGAAVLRKNAHRLLSEDKNDFDWPTVQIHGLSLEAASWMLEALIKCLLTQPIKEWQSEPLNKALLYAVEYMSLVDIGGPAAETSRILATWIISQVDIDNPSIESYREIQEKANALVARGPTLATEGGEMPILLDQLRAWADAPIRGE